MAADATTADANIDDDMSAGTGPAVALCRQEFEDLVMAQLEAYTEKPAETQDFRNACRCA